MTLQDKIAALPPMPTLAAMAEPNRVYLLTEVECLYALNALLCEAMKQYVDDYESSEGMHDAKWYARDFRAVLTACEVTP